MARTVSCGGVDILLGGNVEKYAGNEKLSGSLEQIVEYLVEKYNIAKDFHKAKKRFLRIKLLASESVRDRRDSALYADSSIPPDELREFLENFDKEALINEFGELYSDYEMIAPKKPNILTSPIAKDRRICALLSTGVNEREFYSFMQMMEDYYIDKTKCIYDILYILRKSPLTEED